MLLGCNNLIKVMIVYEALIENEIKEMIQSIHILLYTSQRAFNFILEGT